VVDRAYEWLQLFWPEARTMQLAPRSLRDVPCPSLYITSLVGSKTSGQWNGTSIQIGLQEHRIEFAHVVSRIHNEEYKPIRDDLRETILHEVQHALDDKSAGIYSPSDPFVAHDAAFHRRLRKLMRAFPVEGE
jgi:hypothetical protein